MPISFEEAQNHHPLELTRQASPEVPMTEGEFTLAQLRDMFGTPESSEEDVLATAGNEGMAFFKIGDVYKSFAPKLGETVEPIVSPSQESGVTVTDDNDDDEEDLDEEDLDEEDLEDDDEPREDKHEEDDEEGEEDGHIGSDEHDSDDRTEDTPEQPIARVGTLYEPNDNPDGVIF